ncbi:hypothetical protein VHEMI07897 [[Torrubiella] hemipterigena]|uniref:tripeptidyl-peptidase II n=1 Tax=[Torrubiella] hemipterigena TaxID=1531966 RepID=A0A0A1T510_9HYPO|nr:hypothetical protein VHEMI07897 [[Torrubiella] hemipterigena]
MAPLMNALLPLLVATLATASPMGQMVTKQSLAAIPSGWELKAAAPAEHKIDLHIRLREENLDALRQRTLDVSTPDHPDYGKHLTKEQVDALVAPTKETVESVSKWLASHGVDAGKVESGYLSVTVSVDQAKQLFDADYAVYKHESGRETVRTTKYSLPRDLHSAIAMVQPTTLFSNTNNGHKAFKHTPRDTKESRAADAADAANPCSKGRSTPDCLRYNYNVSGYTPSNKTTIGIAGYLEEVYSADDLSSFLQEYATSVPSDSSPAIVSINNGGTDPSGEGEADLDVQITVPLTYPVTNVYYSTGGRPPSNYPAGTNNTNEPYLDWLQYMMKLDSVPQTITTSYGDDESTVPTDYMDSVCDLFMKLGARGVSLFVSAGDSGTGSSKVSCPNGKLTKYMPSFPASCPWVTTVGGTYKYGSAEQSHPDGGSGFSTHFDQPAYQADAVNAYVKSLNGQFSSYYSAKGRAYPDVAASYTPYPSWHGGFEGLTGGTSAASPTTASIFALVNDYLVSKGKAPLGFLNPWLYKTGKAGLRDIATGHTNVCGSTTSFPASKGWDASSGWGVPDFGKLKSLV